MECARAVLVLENARPAFIAASAMAERKLWLPRSVGRRGRQCMMSWAAEMANTSETGLAFTFQIDSSACDSASSPVEMVMFRGRLDIRSGSTIAALGQVQGIFFVFRRFPDGAPGRFFAASAGSRRNGNERLEPVGRKGLAVFEQGQLFFERSGSNAQSLGGVDCAATAQGHHGIAGALVLPEALVQAGQLRHIRVRTHLLDDVSQSIAQQLLQFPDQTQGTRFGKAHYHHLGSTNDVREFCQAARTEMRCDRIKESLRHAGLLSWPRVGTRSALPV